MDDPGGVYNGDRVTYAIVLENATPAELGDLVVVDLLPEDALDRMVCDPACTWVNEENTIPEPSGGTVVLTVTRAVSWTLPALAAGQSVTLTVSGRVIGQGEGMVLTNYVYAVALREPGPVYADGNDSFESWWRIFGLKQMGALASRECPPGSPRTLAAPSARIGETSIAMATSTWR